MRRSYFQGEHPLARQDSVDQPAQPIARAISPPPPRQRPKPPKERHYVHKICTYWAANARKKGPKRGQKQPILPSFRAFGPLPAGPFAFFVVDRKSTRLNSSHL